MDFNTYQQEAASTAVYPKVYSEEQVVNVLTRAYVRGFPDADAAQITTYVDADLESIETVFNKLVYPILGLLGEAGEIANKFKKILRDQGGQVKVDQEDDLAAEDGDVLWYVSAIASELRVPLAAIADDNITKLFSRQARGVISGNGDTR